MGPIILSPQSQKCNSPLAKEGGHAIGVDGGIDARATKQSPGLFLPNANAFGASCLLHCVQFTHRTLQMYILRKYIAPFYNNEKRTTYTGGPFLFAILSVFI